MRIALVTGHFMPELGYQEVYLARAFARLGHEVRVVTSTALSPSVKKLRDRAYPAGFAVDPDYGFEVHRLPAALSFGANVVVRKLRSNVLACNPDLIIVIGVAKLFAAPLYCDEVIGRSKVIVIFGDAAEYRNTTSTGKKIRTVLQWLLFVLLKRRLYRRAVRFCHGIVLNHPETKQMVRAQLDRQGIAEFSRKAHELSLGFDPDEFFFDAGERASVRGKLGAADDEIVMITATRVNPQKKLEQLIEAVTRLYRAGLKVRYIIIGFADDAYGKALRNRIEGQDVPKIFHCYPFLPHDEIRGLYCAADIGIWLKAAISIQEAMGTGLPVILERKPVVAHLLESQANGWYFNPGELESTLTSAVSELSALGKSERDIKRANTALRNSQRLSYDSIARDIVELATEVK